MKRDRHRSNRVRVFTRICHAIRWRSERAPSSRRCVVILRKPVGKQGRVSHCIYDRDKALFIAINDPAHTLVEVQGPFTPLVLQYPGQRAVRHDTPPSHIYGRVLVSFDSHRGHGTAAVDIVARVPPEATSTGPNMHPSAVLTHNERTPGQAESWSVCALVISTPAENRTVNSRCTGDPIADGERLGAVQVRGEREAAAGEV